MNNNGPVLIVEDDQDDRQLLGEIFQTLPYENEVLLFSDGLEAYQYLSATDQKPFLILSDIHMPRMNGTELCEKISQDDKLHQNFTPFIFFTTSTTKNALMDAYCVSANGFFIKPSSYAGIEQLIRKIMDYWKDCQTPGSYS